MGKGLGMQLKAKEHDMVTGSCQVSPWQRRGPLHQLGSRQEADWHSHRAEGS